VSYCEKLLHFSYFVSSQFVATEIYLRELYTTPFQKFNVTVQFRVLNNKILQLAVPFNQCHHKDLPLYHKYELHQT